MTMRYGKSLYHNNGVYTVNLYSNRNDWLCGRKSLHGIGGSDASAALGMNKWRTNLDLWNIKTGRETAPDISDKPCVQYGSNAEEYIRRLFQLKSADRYDIEYQDNTILQNKAEPFFLYSPDGLIVEKETRRHGIYEGKTTTIMRACQKDDWKDRIPQSYYLQVLHGLNTTGFDFVDLYAEISFGNSENEYYSQLRHYHIERADVLDDLDAEKKGIEDFWNNYVLTDKEPPMVIQGL